jgi:hypothetical protein
MTIQVPSVVAHPTEDVLEEYVFSRLSEKDLAKVENHLLICPSCREALLRLDQFILAMKENSTEAARFKAARPVRGSYVGYGTAIAIAVAALMVAAVAPEIHRTRVEMPVQLVAFRGGESGAMISAQAGSTLSLHVDLSDLTPSPVYRLQIVDEQGKSVWMTESRASGNSLQVKMSPGLERGVYWIRLYSGSELLREFGLRAQ